VALHGGYYSGVTAVFTRGEKVFEISNQVGNVLLTLSEQKLSFHKNSDGIIHRDMSSI
jgi:hypothetical protein